MVLTTVGSSSNHLCHVNIDYAAVTRFQLGDVEKIAFMTDVISDGTNVDGFKSDSIEDVSPCPETRPIFGVDDLIVVVAAGHVHSFCIFESYMLTRLDSRIL